MLQFLDGLLGVTHLGLTVFNLTGWIWKRTRRLHLLALGLTMVSWFGLGLFFGFGYCPLTDWQWTVKEKLGETEIPNSWVKYYVDASTGLEVNARVVDLAVVILALTAFGLSLVLNRRDRRHARRHVLGS